MTDQVILPVWAKPTFVEGKADDILWTRYEFSWNVTHRLYTEESKREEAATVDFVREAFGHLKAIAANDGGQHLLDKVEVIKANEIINAVHWANCLDYVIRT